MKHAPPSWPILLILMALAFAALTGWSLWRAAASGGARPVAGQASRGLEVHHPSASASMSAAPAWTLAPTFDGHILRLRITGQDGLPLTGGTGTVMLGSLSRRPLVFDARSGSYTSDLAGLPVGTGVEVTFSHGGAASRWRLVLNPGP